MLRRTSLAARYGCSFARWATSSKARGTWLPALGTSSKNLNFFFSPISRLCCDSPAVMRWTWTEPSKMPDRRTSPQSWEAAWQRDFEQRYGPGHSPRLSEIIPLFVLDALAASDDSSMMYEEYRRTLYRNQENAAHYITGTFAEFNFEQKWRASTQDKREEVILEGIVRSFDTVLEMNMKRTWCPDSSLKHLAAQDGDVYIRMLKALLPSDVGATIQEPLSIPCQAVDNILMLTEEDRACTVYRVLALHLALCRKECMMAILSNILLAFVRLLCYTHSHVPIKDDRDSVSVATRSRTGAFCPRKPSSRQLDRWHHSRPCT